MTDQQTERVYVAVDVQNVWYAGKEQYGKSARLNFKKLKELISSKPLARIPRQLMLVAYTVTSSTRKRSDGSLRYVGSDKTNRFLHTLRDLGYKVRNRNMHTDKGSEKPFHTDWDVGIAMDAIHYINNYDTFCLVSGDGDYSILIDELKTNEKYVEVVTFESAVSRLLHTSADRVIHLTEDKMYFLENSSGRTQKSSR